MCINPTLNAEWEVKNSDDAMAAIRQLDPNNYNIRQDYRYHLNMKQLALMRIRQYERMKKNGVKF